MESDRDGPESSHRRFLTIVLIGIIAVAGIGYLVGTRTAAEPARTFSTLPKTEGALPGQSYAELRDRRYGPNRAVTSNLEQLAEGLPKAGTLVPQTAEDRARALAARVERRAYDGAPPTIPHVIDEQYPGGCLSCHGKGMKLGDKIASAISHPPYANCTQCHVPGVERPFFARKAPANAFVGLESRGPGPRAWVGAPPQIPHGTFMRENCASCHGPAGKLGLRTPHPQNVSCEQCHVPNMALAPSGLPPWAGVPGQARPRAAPAR